MFDSSRLSLSRRTLLSAGGLSVAGLALLGAAPGSAAAPVSTNAHPTVVPPVLTFRSPGLYPEGVAWDPTRRAFLVGSALYGTVSVVRPDGTVTPLVAEFHQQSIATLGMTVDTVRGRLLVAYANFATGIRSGLGIFNLATGKTMHLVELGHGTSPRLANDVTVDWWGNAYVTDTAGDVIYQVDRNGRITGQIRDPRFDSEAFGVNGIVWHPAGFLLTARFDTGQLFRISPNRNTVIEVTLDQPIAGADGLALRRDGSLIVVANALGGNGIDAVHVLRGDSGWRHARQTHSSAPWPDRTPTTVAVTPFGAYVLSGRLDALLAGDPTIDTFTLRRL